MPNRPLQKSPWSAHLLALAVVLQLAQLLAGLAVVLQHANAGQRLPRQLQEVLRAQESMLDVTMFC